jgi:UDP-glucose 4-epimerase
MKLLVTGGAGYIGSVTSEMLLDEGHEVVIFDSLELGHRDAIDGRAGFIQGDLRHPQDISSAMASVKPDAVVHFAAYAAVGESMAEPQKYFTNNVAGGINLLNAMLEQQVKRIVFSSTCATYGQPDTVPITENESQLPENPYGESKLMYEKILLWHQERLGIEPVFLRYFNACGATEKFGEDHTPEFHLIPLVLQVAMGKRDSIHIFGDDYDTPDGSCVRDYIHIADLAQAHIQALTSKHTGAFNLGNGSGYSVKEVIDVCRDVTGHAIPSEVHARRPGDPPRLIAASAKARDVLGWKPVYPGLHEIVETAWRWHQSHPEGYSQ